MQARLTATQRLQVPALPAYQVAVSEKIKTISLRDETATRKLGADLAQILRAGDVVLLRGDLGAGKTSLARGVIAALTEAEEVPSPTYTLVQTYAAPSFDIWHFDLYRLEDPTDVWELGIEEAVEEGVSLIEWPQRIENLLSGNELDIEIDFAASGRRVTLSGDKIWKERLGEL